MAGTRPCEKGIEPLNRLGAAATRIPAYLLTPARAHRLSAFSADSRTCVASPEEDGWFILSSMLKAIFGWEESETKDNMRSMLNHGGYGLDGFIRFFKFFFVLEHVLEGVMTETKRVPNLKVPFLASSIDTICETASQMADGTARSPIVLDETCDKIADVPDLALNTCTGMGTPGGALVLERIPQKMPGSTSWFTQTKPRGRRCEGIVMYFPPGKEYILSLRYS
ncbi:hypothetical protein EDB83DRAFT_2316476 [Lactarius deliciosus]|nr:hypothetical protein EDB83DRAFT_2316476 [Lactarius deliciosus]